MEKILSARTSAFLHDAFVGSVALAVGLALRLDPSAIQRALSHYLVACLIFGMLVSLTGLLVGMNRGVWRYASIPDLLAIVKTATLSVGVFIVGYFLLRFVESVPRTSMAITWAFLILFLSAPRVLYRLYRNQRDLRRFRQARSEPTRHVLLLGASDEADDFLKALAERSRSAFEVHAIIDERGRRVGRFIRGVPVAAIDNLSQVLEKLDERGCRPDALILARPQHEIERSVSITSLTALAAENGLELLRVPDMLDVHELNKEIVLKPLQLEDLLQRPAFSLDSALINSMIRGRKVLVTGAGGSIGSELVRQIAAFHPAQLVLLDASEFLLYSVDRELQTLFPEVPSLAVLCNVRERDALERIMQELRPGVVFHAAALKHVPLVEAQPLEGLHTNAIGTRNVVAAAIRAKVSAVVQISTDKAVNPTSVMGATKRMAEMYCQAMDVSAEESGTRFMTVRFGNVLGSAGSVVPLFEKQLKTGGPLTVTHPEIERYFMTIPEACVLVLQSAAYGLANPTERGRIFVLDMGSPVKIVELARNLIRLSGLRPDVDVKIVYTGLRPGEKMFEELFDREETLVQTAADGILMAFPRIVDSALVTRSFDELQRLIAAQDEGGALRLLAATVPEFSPGGKATALMKKESKLLSLNRAETR